MTLILNSLSQNVFLIYIYIYIYIYIIGIYEGNSESKGIFSIKVTVIFQNI